MNYLLLYVDNNLRRDIDRYRYK